MKISTFLKFVALFSIIIFFSACNSEETTDETITNEQAETVDNTPEMNVNSEVTAADTSATGVYQEEVDESQEDGLKAALQKKNEVVVEEGGLSFCDCVKKQKELNDLIMETEDDAEMEKAMQELENMKTGECKVLFSTNQNNIEEKQAHARKVKACL